MTEKRLNVDPRNIFQGNNRSISEIKLMELDLKFVNRTVLCVLKTQPATFC